jgi:HEAT repeat protein
LIFQNNSDKKTREKALEGLAYLGDPVSVPVFNKALWSQNKQFRISAAEGLGRVGDKKNIDELQKAERVEKDGDARLAQQFALSALGKDDYLDSMTNALNTKLHADTAQTYLEELTRNPQFLAKIYPYLKSKDATTRRKLATVLVSTGDSTSIAPLEQLSHDSNTDVAAAALRALRATRARVAAQGTTPSKSAGS